MSVLFFFFGGGGGGGVLKQTFENISLREPKDSVGRLCQCQISHSLLQAESGAQRTRWLSVSSASGSFSDDPSHGDEILADY